MQISAEGLFFLPIYGIIELGGEMEELKNRKHPRLDNYYYSSAGAYFVTICTQNRELLFEIENVGNDTQVVPYI